MHVPEPDFIDVYREMTGTFCHGTFIEVGTWIGNSLWHLVNEVMCARKSIRVIGVDDFTATGISGKWFDNVRKEFGDISIRDAFVKRMEIYRQPRDYELFDMPSVRAAEVFRDNSLQFVYIDADHRLASVCTDILVWWRKLACGGILAGHDIRDDDVDLAVRSSSKVIEHKWHKYGVNSWVMEPKR